MKGKTKRITVCGAAAPGPHEAECRLTPNHLYQYHMVIITEKGDKLGQPRLAWWADGEELHFTEELDLDAPPQTVVWVAE